MITSFRLLKPEFIEANIKLEVARPNKTESSMHRSYPLAQRNSIGFIYGWPSSREYKIEIRDLVKVRVLAQKLSEIDPEKSGSLLLALERFGKSYYEIYLEDQLLDYMIAFEALFIGEKRIREKKKTIAGSTAKLLGESENQKQEIIKTIESAYDVRNCIVHADLENTSNANVMISLNCNVENILRGCIRKLL